MESQWGDLWGDSGEDDEDYDPLKDPLNGETGDESESDALEGIQELLSPRRSTSRGRASQEVGDGVGTRSESSSRGHLEGGTLEGSPDVIWKRTRQRIQIPDDVLAEAESQLERAELVLDPMSPCAASNDYNDTTNALANKEYQYVLNVARGLAEPQDDDADDDEDFIPWSDGDGQGPGMCEDDDDFANGSVTVTRKELSDLIAQNKAETSKPSSKYKSGKKKKRKREHNNVSISVLADASTMSRSSGAQGGFTRDQCVQLQGQFRDYFQLSVQQYVHYCSDPVSTEQWADDVATLYNGLAELYRIWEVTNEYNKMQARAMQILSAEMTGLAPGEQQAVQIRPESRFSFFNFPGIELVPQVLQKVSESFGSSESATRTTASEFDTFVCSSSSNSENCWTKAREILTMFEPCFNDDYKIPHPSVVSATNDTVAQSSANLGFTRAEDSLLLAGLQRFKTDWQRIQAHVLPTKSVDEIRSHFRRLVRREEPDNPVKLWRLAQAAGLSDAENDLLTKGVQYFGTRFDLIADRVLTSRSEEELRKAYAKLMASAKSSTTSQSMGTRQRKAADVNSHFLSDLPSRSKRQKPSSTIYDHGRTKSVHCDSMAAVQPSSAFEQETLDTSEDEDVTSGGGARNAAGPQHTPMSLHAMMSGESIDGLESFSEGRASRQILQTLSVSDNSNDAWLSATPAVSSEQGVGSSLPLGSASPPGNEQLSSGHAVAQSLVSSSSKSSAITRTTYSSAAGRRDEDEGEDWTQDQDRTILQSCMKAVKVGGVRGGCLEVVFESLLSGNKGETGGVVFEGKSVQQIAQRHATLVSKARALAQR